MSRTGTYTCLIDMIIRTILKTNIQSNSRIQKEMTESDVSSIFIISYIIMSIYLYIKC